LFWPSEHRIFVLSRTQEKENEEKNWTLRKERRSFRNWKRFGDERLGYADRGVSILPKHLNEKAVYDNIAHGF
jgi:hypothetical protein